MAEGNSRYGFFQRFPQYFLNNLTEENKARWLKLIMTDYKDLTETEKESDRVWARKTLAIFHKEFNVGDNI